MFIFILFLRYEITYYVYGGLIHKAPFLQFLKAYPLAIRMLSTKLTTRVHQPGDVLFRQGQKMENIICLIQGSVELSYNVSRRYSSFNMADDMAIQDAEFIVRRVAPEVNMTKRLANNVRRSMSTSEDPMFDTPLQNGRVSGNCRESRRVSLDKMAESHPDTVWFVHAPGYFGESILFNYDIDSDDIVNHCQYTVECSE